MSGPKSNWFNKLPRVLPRKLDDPWLTNFDYYMRLNRVFGHSFTDCASHPIFPTLHQLLPKVKSFSEPKPIPQLKNVTQELSSGLILPQFFCFPELANGKFPEWATTRFGFAYRMRQSLERERVY
jgi:hypothetical protein